MIEELNELNELVTFFEEKALAEENQKLSKILIKRGVRLREHQWTELEAS